MKTILLIDDNDSFREITTTILLAADYDVLEARCPDDAFAVLRKEQVDLILCDLHMPFAFGDQQREYEESYRVGIQTIHSLARIFPNLPIVALTGTHPEDLRRIARSLAEITTFTKPETSTELLTIVEHCFETPAEQLRVQ